VELRTNESMNTDQLWTSN